MGRVLVRDENGDAVGGVRTLDQIEAWARAHPYRADGTRWTGHSGSLVGHALGATMYYADVVSALLKSGRPNRNRHEAPAGAIHFWSTDSGHAGIDLAGGGARILIADRLVTERFGPGIGTLPFERILSPYVGWTLNYAGHSVRREEALV